MATLQTSGNKTLTVPKEEETALAPYEPIAGIPPVERTMMMIERAINRGAKLEEIQQLLDMKKQVEADEARKAFVAAMSRFKANTITLVKDKINHQYSNDKTTARYTSLGNMVQTVTPFLSQNGLSARWDVEQALGAVKVTCIVTHAQGHSESVAMTCPHDKSGAKNPIQEIKSAITYAKACTFESICGLASTDANVDDDGNGSAPSKRPTMEEQDVVAALDSISGAATLAELHTVYSGNYKAAQKLNDKAAMKAFIDAKDKRKAELQEAAA